MKKKFFIMLILIISNFYIVSCDESSYSGKYECNNNIILELSSDGQCSIIENVYKDAFYTKGKYIIEDNNITITFKNNKTNYYGASSLKGKFEGRKLKIYNLSANGYFVLKKKIVYHKVYSFILC